MKSLAIIYMLVVLGAVGVRWVLTTESIGTTACGLVNSSTGLCLDGIYALNLDNGVTPVELAPCLNGTACEVVK